MDGVVVRPDLWSSFIVPAYALTVVGLVGLLAWAYLSMRAAETRANASTRAAETRANASTRAAERRADESKRR